MSTLLITKETGGYFSFVIDGNTSEKVTNMRNDALAVGTKVHFKTANGANIVKTQNIDVTDITLVASGTFTFATVNLFFAKLIDVGYWDWLLSGGSTGADRFDELLDTFDYFGQDGKAVRVNESQLKLETFTVYNYRKIVDLEDTFATIVPNKMLATNNAGTAIELRDLPTEPENFLNAVGSFNYSDLATQTTPLNAVSGTPLKLTNDTDGAYTNTDFAPYGISSTWNPTTNQFDFSQLSLGDWVEFRTDMFIDLVGTNTSYKLELRCAVGDANAWTLPIHNGERKSTTGFGETHDFAIVMEYQFTIDNPAELWIITDANATVKVNGWQTRVTRKNINIIDIGRLQTAVTKTELDDLISSSDLQIGMIYKISGCQTALYGGTTFYLEAVENNKLSPKGVGKFYTPKYEDIPGNGVWCGFVEGSIGTIVGLFDDNEAVTSDNGATGTLFGKAESGLITPLTGNWATSVSIEGDVSGATATLGVSAVPLDYTIGDTTIYGGYHWENLTGDLGSSISDFALDATNWVRIEYNSTDYNISYDEIGYDFENDFITYRKDNLNNELSFTYSDYLILQDDLGSYLPIRYFQWGNFQEYDRGVSCNIINGAIVKNLNFRGNLFLGNTFGQGAQFLNNALSIYSDFEQNTHDGNSRIVECTFGAGSKVTNCFFGGQSAVATSTFGASTRLTSVTFKENSFFENSVLGAGGQIKYVTFEQIAGIGASNFAENSELSYTTFHQSARILTSNFKENSIIKNCTFGAESLIEDCTFEVDFILRNTDFGSKFNMLVTDIAANVLIENCSFGNNTTLNNSFLDESSIITNSTFGNGVSIGNLTTNTGSVISSCQFGSNCFLTNATLVDGLQFCLFNPSSGIGSNTAFNSINNAIIEANTNIAGVDFTSATIIQDTFSKTIYKRPNGALKIRYYNNSDALTIVNINA